MTLDLGLGTIRVGDCRQVLRELPERSVHCVVTSPPYWGLRDYELEPVTWDAGDPNCEHVWGDVAPAPRRDNQHVDVARGSKGGGRKHSAANQSQRDHGRLCGKCRAWLGSLGHEPTPEQYVRHVVEVFREVRRVLRDDGTLWLNLGDGYDAGTRTSRDYSRNVKHGYWNNPAISLRTSAGLKPKDLMGIPWDVARALRADGWYLRQAVPWYKLAPMPESADDRPMVSHEYVFLLSKRGRYYYDGHAVRRRASGDTHARGRNQSPKSRAAGAEVASRAERSGRLASVTPSRALRTTDLSLDVAREALAFWQEAVANLQRGGMVTGEGGVYSLTTSSEGFTKAHFATFPTSLVRPLLLAGTSERGACPECGAPWARVVDERGRTVGWRPTCACGREDTVPCTVLDPFGGAGTVGLCAQRLKRRFVLIELKPDYAGMAALRIRAGGNGKLMDELAAVERGGQTVLF